jgi:hypothetical protein
MAEHDHHIFAPEVLVNQLNGKLSKTILNARSQRTMHEFSKNNFTNC